jgi:hypothetical protein
MINPLWILVSTVYVWSFHTPANTNAGQVDLQVNPSSIGPTP